MFEINSVPTSSRHYVINVGAQIVIVFLSTLKDHLCQQDPTRMHHSKPKPLIIYPFQKH